MAARRQSPKIKGRKRRFGRRRARQAGEPKAVDLIEEGVHLLRRTSIRAWSVYLCGIAPFVVGFLFFWMEMATSGLAERNLLPASLGMALLFIGFKGTQCYLAQGLREALLGEDVAGWRIGTWLRVWRRQAFWQATGVFVLPIAFVLTVPFAWAFAFYQNLLTADPESADPAGGGVLRENWQLAKIWHEQNWVLLSLLSLIAFLSWLNVLSMLLFGPYLLKSLLGIETVFSRAGFNLLNSTTLFAGILLAYVVTDPLVKAVYLLRRHYGESRRNGADLRLRLGRYARRRRAAGLVSLLVFLALGVLAVAPVPAAAAEFAASAPSVDVEQLDSSIDEVLDRREFVWRFPREAVDSGETRSWLRSWMDSLEAFQERIERWVEGLLGVDREKKNGRSVHDGIDLGGAGNLLSYLLIGGFVVLVLLLALRAWRAYQPVESLEGHHESATAPEPDLEDEAVSADLMPRDRWLDLAQKLIAAGDYRLALRAYFLAQLSALSSDGLLVIRKAKSNREYARELSQRGQGRRACLEVFWDELRLFERIWYGDCPPGPEEIRQMEAYLREQGVLG